jgi:hypothetical protein
LVDGAVIEKVLVKGGNREEPARGGRADLLIFDNQYMKVLPDVLGYLLFMGRGRHRR